VPRARRVALLVERAQSIHHVIKSDRRMSRTGVTQRRRRIDGACVGRPRGEDGALLVQRQVRIANDFARMRKRLRRMEQFIEIEFASRQRRIAVEMVRLSCHGHSLNAGRPDAGRAIATSSV